MLLLTSCPYSGHPVFFPVGMCFGSGLLFPIYHLLVVQSDSQPGQRGCQLRLLWAQFANVISHSFIRAIFQHDKTLKEFHFTYHKVSPLSVFTQRQIAFSTCPSSLSTLVLLTGSSSSQDENTNMCDCLTRHAHAIDFCDSVVEKYNGYLTW